MAEVEERICGLEAVNFEINHSEENTEKRCMGYYQNDQFVPISK